MKRKILAITLAFLLLISSTQISFAGYKYEEVDLGKVSTVCYQEMWHYSGGYWKLEPGTDYEEKITDYELANAMNIIGYLKDHYTCLVVPLPTNVLSAYTNGDYITFNPVTYYRELSDLFDEDSFYGYIEGSNLYLFGHPNLPLFGLKTFDDYIKNLNVTLPLIDSTYGNNLYSIYKKGAFVGTAKGGYYSNEKYVNIIKNQVHPYMITDNTGLLRKSYQITIDEKDVFYPSSHYVGWGTFRDGGAVGVRFTYPISVEFSAFQLVWEEDPYIPPDDPDPIIPDEPSGKWVIHRKK